MADAPGKRERLVAGAREVFHARGVERTTLADIATAADVPLGNVYYYFRTKDALVEAAVDDLREELREALAALESEPTPEARLKAFVRLLVSEAPLTARQGCPLGTLVSELNKREDETGGAWPDLMRIPIDWAERQFRELGREDADELAVALIASYEGIALLTGTFRDPELMAREGRRLERWIGTLA
ncbi:TetR/AcrR family transcriptional regulator [Solirubrobacter phytolaccae]|uniref:TetR/AcrR family transcriptional regulator n=1 Tax=Solirubrobacter phytolaccae TaxID=1404360 RepID=A0A9X3SD57_9ACTN|nr:TetR/AcrR family transcriptional regulator [Solirubrobacter phytolaccae]MDA0179387.1 TetR/AcrR family transcriptional regulator [Solirubrobacter phytolaccae]